VYGPAACDHWHLLFRSIRTRKTALVQSASRWHPKFRRGWLLASWRPLLRGSFIAAISSSLTSPVGELVSTRPRTDGRRVQAGLRLPVTKRRRVERSASGTGVGVRCRATNWPIVRYWNSRRCGTPAAFHWFHQPFVASRNDGRHVLRWSARLWLPSQVGAVERRSDRIGVLPRRTPTQCYGVTPAGKDARKKQGQKWLAKRSTA